MPDSSRPGSAAGASVAAGQRPGALGDVPAAAVPGGVTGDRVAVRFPAVSAYLSVLRVMTSSLAARMDFSLDEIEDLRIAVDEACVMLLSAALPGADMEVVFELAVGVLDVSVTVPTLTGAEPATDTFAWTVLCALADDAHSRVGPDNRVTIDLRKRRAVSRSGEETL